MWAAPREVQCLVSLVVFIHFTHTLGVHSGGGVTVMSGCPGLGVVSVCERCGCMDTLLVVYPGNRANKQYVLEAQTCSQTTATLSNGL